MHTAHTGAHRCTHTHTCICAHADGPFPSPPLFPDEADCCWLTGRVGTSWPASGGRRRAEKRGAPQCRGIQPGPTSPHPLHTPPPQPPGHTQGQRGAPSLEDRQAQQGLGEVGFGRRHRAKSAGAGGPTSLRFLLIIGLGPESSTHTEHSLRLRGGGSDDPQPPHASCTVSPITGMGGTAWSGVPECPDHTPREGRQLPGVQEACFRQVTQPASSPEKCVSETAPVNRLFI